MRIAYIERTYGCCVVHFITYKMVYLALQKPLSSLSAGQSIACPIRMSLYIYLLYYIYHLICFTCIDFYDFSAWGGCWFVFYIRRFIYKFLNVCPFDYTAVAGCGNVWPVNQVNHTSWVAVVTPTDRPKSVRNHCLIELFCGVFFFLSLCPFDISVGVGAFIIGLSQISSFLSSDARYQDTPMIHLKYKATIINFL